MFNSLSKCERSRRAYFFNMLGDLQLLTCCSMISPCGCATYKKAVDDKLTTGSYDQAKQNVPNSKSLVEIDERSIKYNPRGGGFCA